VVASEVRKLAERAQGAAKEIGALAGSSVKVAERMGQVSKAMATVDQVTQRNASAAEELSSTAEEMASQAEGLQHLVAFFQLHAAHQAKPGAHALARQAAAAPPPARPVAGLNPHAPRPAVPATAQAADGGFQRF
jgi:methyl-accepting chemotaxis protein